MIGDDRLVRTDTESTPILLAQQIIDADIPGWLAWLVTGIALVVIMVTGAVLSSADAGHAGAVIHGTVTAHLQ